MRMELRVSRRSVYIHSSIGPSIPFLSVSRIPTTSQHFQQHPLMHRNVQKRRTHLGGRAARDLRRLVWTSGSGETSTNGAGVCRIGQEGSGHGSGRWLQRGKADKRGNCVSEFEKTAL